jgi:heterodisulfide reductase subunit A-like polyferredoxin
MVIVPAESGAAAVIARKAAIGRLDTTIANFPVELLPNAKRSSISGEIFGLHFAIPRPILAVDNKRVTMMHFPECAGVCINSVVNYFDYSHRTGRLTSEACSDSEKTQA